MKVSISMKIILALAILLTITTSLLSWKDYNAEKKDIKKDTEQKIKIINKAFANKIEGEFNSRIKAINLAADVIDSNFNKENIQNTFNTKTLKDNFLFIFGGLDTDGKAISNDPTWKPEGWDARQRPWYNQTKKVTGITITEPYVDSATNQILVSIVAAITDKGEFKGGFGGDVSLIELSKELKSINFDNSGYAFVLNDKGKIISHPDHNKNGHNYKELFTEATPLLNDNIQEISINGNLKWVIFTPIKMANLSWYIGAVVDESIINEKVHQVALSGIYNVLINVFLCIIVISFIMKIILKPIVLMKKSLEEMNNGNGDLTKRIPILTNDELSELAIQFNQFISHLQGIIINIKDSSSHTTQKIIAAENNAHKSSTELHNQLLELDQLATAMNQMSCSATEVAQNTQQASASVVSADKEAQNGVEVVIKTTNLINELAEHLETAVHSVNELSKYSSDIESIVSVITAISEQTNLLALNAAIEAARAGEYGRGFAVVADEVRNLASKTQDSTKEIEVMIAQLQSSVSSAEGTIKESNKMALVTSQEAREVQSALTNISTSVHEIHDMNLQIAAAAEEQSVTTEEININTNNIKVISEHVSILVKEQVEHTEDIQQEALEQNKLLKQFIV